MAIIKRKSHLNIFICILQVIVMFFLFLLLVDKQTVYFIRDIVQQLDINADLQSLLARMFLGFRMTFDLPSIIGLILCITQVAFAKWIVKEKFFFLVKKCVIVLSNIEYSRSVVNQHDFPETNKYLINMRLLN